MKILLTITVLIALHLPAWSADQQVQRDVYRQKLEAARQEKAAAERIERIEANRSAVVHVPARTPQEVSDVVAYILKSTLAQMETNKSLSPRDGLVEVAWVPGREGNKYRFILNVSAKDAETIKRYSGSGTPGTPEYQAPNHHGLAMARHDEEKTDKLGVWSRLFYRIVLTVEIDDDTKTVHTKLATISRATGPYPVIEGSAPLAEYRKLVDEYLDLFIGAHTEHLAENGLLK